MLEKINHYRERVAYQAMLLAITCGLAAFLLVATETVTRPLINQRLAEDQRMLLTQVLSNAPFTNDVFAERSEVLFNGKTYQVYPVRNNRGVFAHVIKGREEGYSGEITFLVGVDLSGLITGVRVVSHSETPGLGDKIELAKSPWVLSFNHHSLANTAIWKVKKDGGEFDQFSGATITPRSVVRGVYNALEAMENLSKKVANNEQ